MSIAKNLFFRIFKNFHRATIVASILQTFPLVHVRFCLIVGWFCPATNMVGYYFWLPNTTFLDYTALLIFLLLFFLQTFEFPFSSIFVFMSQSNSKSLTLLNFLGIWYWILAYWPLMAERPHYKAYTILSSMKASSN